MNSMNEQNEKFAKETAEKLVTLQVKFQHLKNIVNDPLFDLTTSRTMDQLMKFFEEEL